MIELKEAPKEGALDQHWTDTWNDRDQGILPAHCFPRIENRTARVGIIGLGYVGLPLARAFVEKGYSVLGFDTDASKVERLRGGGKLHRPHSGLMLSVRCRLAEFEPTNDFLRLGEPEASSSAYRRL